MTARLLAGAIGLCLLLQLHLVFVQPINWDEFRFLADVHAYARGELSAVLLTFQVHLFGWLVGLGDEFEQIRIARLVMLALECGTLALIWVVARRFFAAVPALFAVLGYLTFSFVLQHGASFRFDPIVTFLVMLSLALMLRERLRWVEMAVVGLALALAMMVTVKTVLASPLVVAIGVHRLTSAEDRRDAFLRLGLAATSSAVFLAALYAWHIGTLAAPTGAEAHLAASYSNTLAEVPFFPRAGYFLRSVMENPIHWLMLLLGTAAAIGALAAQRSRALSLLAFLLPLLSLLFYRNAYPYFYGFVLAPAAILFATAAERNEIKRIVWLPSLLMTALALVHYQAARSEAGANQRLTIAAIHAMFPQPVAYLDRCSMIASFPQAGVFLSTMMLEDYREAGRPILRELLIRRQPVFLIANSGQLRTAMVGGAADPGNPQLLPEDQNILRRNFVHHWGPIFVAGQRVAADPRPSSFEILVSGPYTIESEAPLVIDGQSRRQGDVVALSRGRHVVRSVAGRQTAVLRWGERLGRPRIPAPRGSLFGRF